MKHRGRIRSFFKSLRFRLIIAFILFGLLPMTFMQFGLIYSYNSRAVTNRSIDILAQSKIISDQMANAGYLDNFRNDSINSRLELISNVYDGRVLVVNSTFHIIKDTYDMDTNKIIISEEVAKCFGGKEISKYDSANRYIEVALPIKDPQTADIIGVLLVSVSTDNVRDTRTYLINRGTIITISALVAVVALAITFAILSSQPFKKMTLAIDEVQSGFSDGELHAPEYSETEEISSHVNSLINRMKLLDDSRTEFVSNVSHELKTPLTSMKVLADSLVGMENVPVELYQDFMNDITNEIDRENKIITDLLELVKMDRSSERKLNIEQINVNELLEIIMKRITPIAEKQGVELVMESFRPVAAKVDETKLSLAFSNLIENAVKYNDKEDGWVHVTLNADHRYMYVKVEDNGCGMPEESLDHIFERFYRVDKSHSREIGGTGLGLAITKSVVLLHKGEIKVFSTEGEGTIFTVRIPLNYIG